MSTSGDDGPTQPTEPVDFTKPAESTTAASGPPSQAPLPQYTTYRQPAGTNAAGLGVGRIIGLVLASLLALFALGVITAGGFLTWVHGSRDADGFLSTSTESLSTPTAALSSAKVDINVGGIGWFADHLGTIRITATSTSGKPIFVGIAPQADVTSWLGTTSVDRIKDLQFEPFSATLERLPGSATAVKSPVAQTFWTVRATGAMTAVLEWKVTAGNWAVVIANADGSPGVAVATRLGAKFSWLGPLGWGLIIAGVVLFLLAVVVVILLLRSRTPRKPLTVQLVSPPPGDPR